MGNVDVQKIRDDVRSKLGLVPSWIEEMPDSALDGFWKLMWNFELSDETHIPPKYKDLIGLAVSGATRCRYCALFHTEGARLHGATDEEISEASFVGAMTMLASTYINAQQVEYDTFADETRKIMDYVKANMPPKQAVAK